MLKKARRRFDRLLYPAAERVLRNLQRTQLSRGAVLEGIPRPSDRGGGLGTTTYGEWCYTVGLLQGLIFRHLPQERPIRMLDVGCGVGRLYLAAKPSLTAADHYTGLDVGASLIDICRRNYREPNCSFVHVEASNAYYAREQNIELARWPFEAGAFNFVTALSVWSHFKEEDWKFYLREVSRVLSGNGRALISFFILDDVYRSGLSQRTSRTSAFYLDPENKWVFDTPAYGSAHWWCPSWAEVPEIAIGVDREAFDEAVAAAGLRVVEYLPGWWKDQPGTWFQDFVLFQKA